MRIAIIGAGFTGLTAAATLCEKGHDVTVFEKDPQPGGLAIGYKEPEWQWTLEKHYHHWFVNDKSVLALAKKISYPVLIKRPKTSIWTDEKMYQLDSPGAVLTFPKLSLFERLQMAATLGLLRYNPFWQPLEKFTTTNVLPKMMGKHAYSLIWEPQLRKKFGSFSDDISLAWFWARVKKRTAQLAYPEGGFLPFAEALSTHITKLGGKTFYNTQVTKIEQTKEKLSISYEDAKKKIIKTQFDRVIVTLPSYFFLQLIPDVPSDYKQKLLSLKGLGAVNLVLRLRKPFFTDNTYWLSVCDNDAAFMAVVEHTNFMDKKNYNNEHLVYVGNYLPANHPYHTLSNTELLKKYDADLRRINPDYKKHLIGSRVFSAPFAQPIIPPNYSKMIPSFETPIKNVFLANMQQVYPWDRGTNYAVELGEKIANRLL